MLNSTTNMHETSITLLDGEALTLDFDAAAGVLTLA